MLSVSFFARVLVLTLHLNLPLPRSHTGDPVDLEKVPEVWSLIKSLMNQDGDEERIPQSQQVYRRK